MDILSDLRFFLTAQTILRFLFLIRFHGCLDLFAADHQIKRPERLAVLQCDPVFNKRSRIFPVDAQQRQHIPAVPRKRRDPFGLFCSISQRCLLHTSCIGLKHPGQPSVILRCTGRQFFPDFCQILSKTFFFLFRFLFIRGKIGLIYGDHISCRIVER